MGGRVYFCTTLAALRLLNLAEVMAGKLLFSRLSLVQQRGSTYLRPPRRQTARQSLAWQHTVLVTFISLKARDPYLLLN